jgi:hypothetical protein
MSKADEYFTPEQRAEHKAIHERFLREQPGIAELLARGEIDEPVPHGEFMDRLLSEHGTCSTPGPAPAG